MKKLYNANDKDRLVIFGTANKQLADYIFTNYSLKIAALDPFP